MENMKKIVPDFETEASILLAKNIKYIKKIHSYNDKEMSEISGIATSTFSKSIREDGKGKIPAIYPFFANMKARFGYTIDDLLSTDLEALSGPEIVTTDVVPETKYQKFYGVFQGNYFDTNASKGREKLDDADALKYCVIVLYQTKDVGAKKAEHKVMASFNMNKEDAEKLYTEVYKNYNGYGWAKPAAVMWEKREAMNIYYGSFGLSEEHLFINVKSDNQDTVSMVFYNSYHEKFIGGLGVVTSISTGRLQEPTMQYMGLSRYLLDTSKEEIASHLLATFPKVKIYESVDKLVEMKRDLYGGDSKSNLEDEEKKIMMRFYIEKILNDTIARNLFRKVSVSVQDDEDFRDFILRVEKQVR